MITHGHPTGYQAGCRGQECPNWHTELMTCTEADLRHHGDYAYIKAVADGTATAEKYAAPKIGPRIVTESPEAAKKRAARVVRAKSPKPRNLKTAPSPIKHGTIHGANKGCRDCPATPSCIEVRRLDQKARRARAKEVRDGLRIPGTPRRAPLPWKPPGSTKHKKWEHGTRQGAAKGCSTDCPASPSCIEVSRKYNNDRYAERNAA